MTCTPGAITIPRRRSTRSNVCARSACSARRTITSSPYTYATAGRLEEAEELATDVAVRWPGRDAGLRAWLVALRGDPAAAFTMLKTAAAEDTPTGELARNVLAGELAIAAGRWADAERAAARDPESGFQAAQRIRFQGHYLTCRGAFARALEDLVNSGIERVHLPVVYVRALFTLGMLNVELGDTASGREMLNRFLDHSGAADWPLDEVQRARNLVKAVRKP